MNFKKRVNGSWTDTPHYIHNTSTDTITTLPTVIYPTDTTATVGLKGQTLQSSIPSPTSPVMPEGCGDLETSGEKAGQYKIPILSNSTTTNVYLGEVQSTRRIGKIVLNGTETWSKSSAYRGNFWARIIPTDAVLIGGLCTHAQYESTISQSTFTFGDFSLERGSAGQNNIVDLFIGESSWEATDFQAYLASEYSAGHPVTIYYILTTPQTAVVNEPLRKIGDYADTVSGITIPTIAGANTLSVDTTLQPSEVTVNYHGWHPVSAVHERENGAWT